MMSAAKRNDAQRALIDEAAAWRVREADGELSIDEQAALEAWLGASDENRAAYARVEAAWSAVGAAAGERDVIAMRGEAFALARRAGRVRRVCAALFKPASVLAVVASLALAILAGFLWRIHMPDSYATGVGERRVVMLDDGSRLSLDAVTEVRVRYSQARRELWLDHGRAKFDVAHDPLRPFAVSAESRTVVATGTSFTVELIDDEMRVVLYEGSVSVLERVAHRAALRPVPIVAPDSGRLSSLAPGHELIAPAGANAVAYAMPADPVRSLAWEAGQLVFDDEPLGAAVARMNRYTRAPLSIGDPAVAQMRISGVFREGDTAAFVDGVAALLPVRAASGPRGEVLLADPERSSRSP